MEYYLQRNAIGQPKKVQISSQEFNQIKIAKEKLNNLFKITENYRVVMTGFQQVEEAKYKVELEHLLYQRLDYEDISDARIALNAPVSGYLASARYFLDSSHKIGKSLLSSDSLRDFEKLFNDIYDADKGYRFIEALRNYSQHRALPIQRVIYNNSVEDHDNIEEADHVISLSILAEKKILADDDKFKTQALEGMPEEIDIIHCIRLHMAGIWQLHAALIEKTKDDAAQARETLIQACVKFGLSKDESSVGLTAFAEADGTVAEQIPILLKWDDARLRALKRLGNLKKLARRYVSGKITNKIDTQIGVRNEAARTK